MIIRNYKKKGRTLLQRLQDLSIVDQVTECWEWLGNKYTDGYPQIQVNGKPMRGNRAALLTKGEFDQALYACHTCDNPSCVNPEHIFAGTQSDNIKDSWNKGRQIGNSKNRYAK